MSKIPLTSDVLDEKNDFDTISKRMRRTLLPEKLSRAAIDALPRSAGVYLFYDENGQTLYIGKSIHIRTRVLSHFNHRSRRSVRIAQEITDIKTIQTSGELSALLLESHLIKTHLPVYNRLSRYSPQLIVVTEISKGLYKGVDTSLYSYHDLPPREQIVGIFRSVSRAKQTLEAYATEYNLCPVLLGLEKSDRGCFSYHIGKCKGACVGKEPPETYNKRFKKAFHARKIKTWPYKGPILVNEQETSKQGTIFIVDEWRLIGSYRYEGKKIQSFLPQSHIFDYDTYKILVRALPKFSSIKSVTMAEVERLLKHIR